MERSCINCSKDDVCVIRRDGMTKSFLDPVEGDIVKLVAEFQRELAKDCRSYLEKRKDG